MEHTDTQQDNVDVSAAHGTLSPGELRTSVNPALARLAAAIDVRNSDVDTVNYSRMHHRHARSHTRK